MSLARFVESLLADGRVRVSAAVGKNGSLLIPSPDDLEETTSILTAFDAEYRTELPGTPPEISVPAMLWGAQTVFRASSFLAHRDANAEIIGQALMTQCPAAPSPMVSYSVDLTLRFLPDLIRLAKAVSSDDPLISNLISLGHQWPLSSVGIANIGSVDTAFLIGSDCLLRMYVDRVIAARDHSRIDEPHVREAVRVAIGIHHDLAPEFKSALVSNTTH